MFIYLLFMYKIHKADVMPQGNQFNKYKNKRKIKLLYLTMTINNAYSQQKCC